MKPDDNLVLREQESAFWGTITASISHEMNNVMSIINECAGLLDDLIAATGGEGQIDCDKVQGTSQNIAKQVKRGTTIIKRLNRFAHSCDAPLANVDLNTLILEVVGLAQRFVRLKRVCLETELEDADIMLDSNAFVLQHAIFVCIQLSLNATDLDQCITIRSEKGPSGAIVQVTCHHRLGDEEAKNPLCLLALLMEQLGGKAEITSQDGEQDTIVLKIPFSTTGKREEGDLT
jgi:C4-dicarboxylate-specific signal transduction histidine kinase